MILSERDIVLRFQALETRVAALEAARVVALADKPTELDAAADEPVDQQPAEDAPAPASGDSADTEAAA